MSNWIISIAIWALGTGAFFLIAKKFSSKSNTEALGGKEEILKKIEECREKIEKQKQYLDSYISRSQFEGVAKKVEQARVGLENDKRKLREIEQKLETAQKDVEKKEAQQQDTRSAKEEHDTKLADLLTRFDEMSTDCVSLEQNLAQSLKNLDAIMAQLDLTEMQKAVLLDLSNTLQQASSNLRDLIFDYQTVNERLKGLTQQHADLEEEYTRLVEQQLGQ